MSHIFLGDSGRFYKRNNRDILIGVVSSSNNNGYHMPLIDYDHVNPINDICALVKKINEFKLPNFYVFKTSKGKYMTVCFKNIARNKFFNILLYLNCCVNFRYYTICIAKQATIRFTKKWYKKTSHLQLIYIIHSKYNKYENKKLKNEFFKVIGYESKTIHTRV